MDRVARRLHRLCRGGWHGGPLPRPGVHVESVGVYLATGLGNILGGPGRGSGPLGPGYCAARAGVLEPDMGTWDGPAAGPGVTATRNNR